MYADTLQTHARRACMHARALHRAVRDLASKLQCEINPHTRTHALAVSVVAPARPLPRARLGGWGGDAGAGLIARCCARMGTPRLLCATLSPLARPDARHPKCRTPAGARSTWLPRRACSFARPLLFRSSPPPSRSSPHTFARRDVASTSTHRFFSGEPRQWRAKSRIQIRQRRPQGTR